MSRQRPDGVWPWLVVAHTVVVVALTTLFLVLSRSTAPEEGANIGAGIIALPLLVLGLPWSLPAIINPYWFDDAPMLTWHVVIFGPAILNVALHGVVSILARTRTHRRRAHPDR